MKYLPPALAVEGTGVKRGLTAVEAAVLLEAPLNKVMTMILFGLVKKGVLIVESEKPLKVQVVDPLPEDVKLWYYERRFLKAIERRWHAGRGRAAGADHRPDRRREQKADRLQPQRDQGLLPGHRRPRLAAGGSRRHARGAGRALGRGPGMDHARRRLGRPHPRASFATGPWSCPTGGGTTGPGPPARGAARPVHAHAFAIGRRASRSHCPPCPAPTLPTRSSAASRTRPTPWSAASRALPAK